MTFPEFPPTGPTPQQEPREPKRRDRTPIILGVVAGVLAVAVGVTLTIALTRSPAGPAADPATPPSQTSSAPEPEATVETPDAPDETAAPAGVQLGAGGFMLVDDAGDETFSYGWSDPIEGAVTALTDAFGAEPEERTEAGNGTTYPDYTVYQWPGFALYDMVPLDGGPTRDEYSQPSYLRYTANAVGDAAVTAEFDVEIGMPVAEVEALNPDAEVDRDGGPRFVFGADRSGFAGGVPTYSMVVDTDGDAVTAILYFYYAG